MEASAVGELGLWHDNVVSSVKFNLHILKLIHSSFHTLYNICFRMNIKWQHKHVFKTVNVHQWEGYFVPADKKKPILYMIKI